MEVASSSSSQQQSFKAPEGRYFYLPSDNRVSTVAFNYQHSTHLTHALLQGGGGPEEGAWILYNIGEYLYIRSRDDNTRKEQRSLSFSGTSSKPAAPTCHAFGAAKEGPDLLVGLSDGSVELLSLRAQLKLSPSSSKPSIVATVSPEAEAESSRCTAVAWIPRPDGMMFAVACASGSVYVYKKSSVIGESTSKFLSLKSSNKNPSPLSVLTVSSSGITDMAVSTDGGRMAVACRDGVLRLLDTTSGAVVGGYRSYFGAMLCCCFSPDGRFVASGSEDDLVTVYDIQEKAPIAHCEGHRSWVSSVRFDPWAQLSSPGGPGAGIAGIYRLASVGQDAQLCLWEVQVLVDGEGALMPAGNMRKSTSQASLQTAGWQSADMPPTTTTTSSIPTTAPGTPKGGKGIFPSLPRSELLLYEPILERKLHQEPLSDVLVADTMIYTADHTGGVKAWLRPRPRASQPGSKQGGGVGQ